MPYLIPADYKKLIQSDNLNQIIGNDTTILEASQLAAVTEAISYLVQKYLTSQEFADMLPWNIATIYNAGDRIFLSATAYSATTIYNTNDLVLQSGSIYKSIAGNAAHAFNIAEWALIGVDNALFYAKLPYPEFQYQTIYNVGNQVYWKGKTYTALKATVIASHEQRIQGDIQDSIYNVFPDDALNGVSTWGVGIAYTVAAGTLPTDTAKWVSGDSRNQQLVNYCIDITLYHVHSRISPRNIPELRVKRYDDAIKWLKGAAQGTYITADLPLVQPKQGMRIRFGGNTKVQNQY